MLIAHILSVLFYSLFFFPPDFLHELVMPVPTDRASLSYQSTATSQGGWRLSLLPLRSLKAADCIFPNCCSCNVRLQHKTLWGKDYLSSLGRIVCRFLMSLEKKQAAYCEFINIVTKIIGPLGSVFVTHHNTVHCPRSGLFVVVVVGCVDSYYIINHFNCLQLHTKALCFHGWWRMFNFYYYWYYKFNYKPVPNLSLYLVPWMLSV